MNVFDSIGTFYESLMIFAHFFVQMGISLLQNRVSIGQWYSKGPKKKRPRPQMPTFYSMSMKAHESIMMDPLNEGSTVKPSRKLSIFLLTCIFILSVTGKRVNLNHILLLFLLIITLTWNR